MASSTTFIPTWGWGEPVVERSPTRDDRVPLSDHKTLLSALRYWQDIMVAQPVAQQLSKPPSRYSVIQGAKKTFETLWRACQSELPRDVDQFMSTIEISSRSEHGDQAHFPSPLREQEAIIAIKALEACTAAAIGKLRHREKSPKIEVDVDKASVFLMSAYLTTLDGLDKANPKIRKRIPDTDLNQAQSVLYRRFSANLYRTKNPGEYYHIHGSLDADTTLEMLGLPKHNPDLTDYDDIIRYIEAAVKKYTAEELDKLNLEHRQAGIQAYTWEQFQNTEHGKLLTSLPPLTVRPNKYDTTTPPAPFPSIPEAPKLAARHALEGIKVLELCRIIAGPTIGRSLAAHGAQVIKVTCPTLPDVPFFPLDVNTGKHAIHLNLKDASPNGDRAKFDTLLLEADVLIDGYRPGALARLGYSPERLAELARQRGRGYVYVAEDCFGGSGLTGAAEDFPTAWSKRAGWQQIADCVTGAAWAQGRFMGLDEPVVPPFPMSDYGTGALGCLAAMAGLYRRATEGGSWVCRTSLCQYDVFLLGLGLLPEEEQERLRKVYGFDEQDPEGFFSLRYCDSVDTVGKKALKGMRKAVPHLFDENGQASARLMHRARSKGFKGDIRWPREPIKIDGLRVGHVRTARPNGYDTLKVGKDGQLDAWNEWEEDEIDQEVE